MNYIEINQFGAASTLQFKSKEAQKLNSSTDVRIDVHYSGINFADVMMRLGLYPDAPPKPFTPGYEVSGVISEVGEDVNDLKVGDRVMAGTRFGGYVSDLIVPESYIIPVPESFSLEEAAATPVNFITTHIALNEFARVRKGDKILIKCATGGVGVFCMQVGKAIGAEVYGLTSSDHKKSFIESYGAIAMNYEEYASSDIDDFDFILNATGGKTVKSDMKKLAKSGLLTCIGMSSTVKNGKTSLLAKLRLVVETPLFYLFGFMMNSYGVSGFNALTYLDDEKWLDKNLKFVAENPFKPHIGKVFKAKDVSLAHEFLESKQAKGKVLLAWKD